MQPSRVLKRGRTFMLRILVRPALRKGHRRNSEHSHRKSSCRVSFPVPHSLPGPAVCLEEERLV